MTTYQDKWRDGRVDEAGYRECEHRYMIVRDFCRQKFDDAAFTVCDIGANMCYFGLRLTEDFEHCAVMAFEFHQFQARYEHVKKSDRSNRLLFLNRKVSIDDLRALAALHRFDVVLAMSVIHHLPGDHVAWMRALRALGRHVIAEFAGDDNAVRVRSRIGYAVPGDAEVLGYGDSHLMPHERPIVLLTGAGK